MIETVGLGQNEIEIDNVADLVMYIVPPGSGDALQGGKKGIMEIADLLVVTKCDGNLIHSCNNIKKHLEDGIQYQQQRYINWTPPIIMSSSAKDMGMPEIYHCIKKFQTSRIRDIVRKRNKQNINNLWTYVTNVLAEKLRNDETIFSPYISKILKNFETDPDYPPYEGAESILEKVFGKYEQIIE